MKATGLTTVVDTAPVLESDGDILLPLRRIAKQYVDKAKYLAALEVRPQGDGMYYETAAQNVRGLIEQ